MRKTPLISVVVPVYNGRATILETLDSVLNQTHENLEVVVVDDGSTDGTRAALGGLSDARLEVVQQQRGGVGAARNRGIRESRGDLISFVDADDLWAPDKLEQQVAALNRAPDAAVVYSWTDFIDAEGLFIGSEDRVCFEGEVREDLLRRFFLASASNALVRRDALLAVDGWCETLKGAADWDLFLRLAERYRFACARSVGVYYRITTTSMSGDVTKQEEVCRAVIERALERQPVSSPRVVREFVAGMHLYLWFRALGDEARPGDLRHAARHLARCILADPLLLARRPTVAGKLLARLAIRFFLPEVVRKRATKWWRRRRSGRALRIPDVP